MLKLTALSGADALSVFLPVPDICYIVENTAEAGKFLLRFKEFAAYMNPPQLAVPGYDMQFRHKNTAAGQRFPGPLSV